MESNEATREEVEALKSIYCEPEEFKVCCYDTDGEVIKAIKRIEVTCPLKCCKSVLMMTLTIPSEYPDVLPEICLSSRDLSIEILARTKDAAEKKAQSLLGQPMMMDLFLYVEDIYASSEFSGGIPCNKCSESSVSKDDQKTVPIEDDRISTALLQIDHMRSKSSYIKTLSNWAKDLKLSGCVLFHDRLILLVLQGNIDNIREFILRLRTVNIDVDSRGRSCKERMSKVLAEPQHVNGSEQKRLADFSIIDTASWNVVEDLFRQHNLGKLYSEHVHFLKKR